MNELPDLSCLSDSEKGALILCLWRLLAQVDELQARVVAQQALIDELRGRLSLSSRNSSKPPSSDGLNKPKPKSLRGRSGKSPGGQAGRRGVTLEQVQHPDEIIRHRPPQHCGHCHRPLTTESSSVGEVRQVFEVPVIKARVIEHQSLQVQCQCGALHRGAFPSEVQARVQYGATAQATMVYLNQQQLLPLARTAAVMGDLYGLPVSQAAVLKAGEDAAARLKPTVDSIAEHLKNSAVLHADETGIRINTNLHWLHVAATPTLTWIARHPKRGRAAFEEHGILNHFKGTLIHDGWSPYRSLECAHALCNAHHLRELTYVFEELEQPWAGRMIELLGQANQMKRDQFDAPAPALEQAAWEERIRALRQQYVVILEEGEAANPRASAQGKRGVAKQTKAANLLHRLREHADDIWRFMHQAEVPFTNNLAEQAVRMPKVKQKISGCFRTPEGADTFCIIRSYLASIHKQGADLFNALCETFRGQTPQPAFA